MAKCQTFSPNREQIPKHSSSQLKTPNKLRLLIFLIPKFTFQLLPPIGTKHQNGRSNRPPILDRSIAYFYNPCYIICLKNVHTASIGPSQNILFPAIWTFSRAHRANLMSGGMKA